MKTITIAGVLGFVAMFAIGLAALIRATNVWTGIVFALAMGLLLGSALGVILRGWRRGGRLGFALFGWGYFLVGNISGFGPSHYPWLLPDTASQWVFSMSNPSSVPEENSDKTDAALVNAYIAFQNDHNERYSHSTMIGRWLWVLLFAEFGALLGRFLARPRESGEVTPIDRPVADSPSTLDPPVP